MSDILDPNKRSQVMAAVKSSGNRSTERRLRALLIKYGIRGWQLQYRELPGTPDFIFPKKHIVIFIDGCFWHGCPKCYRRPKSKHRYWDNKLQNNILRDKKVNSILKRNGWKVMRFWEHSLRKSKDSIIVLNKIRNKLRLTRTCD
jgi:DNA mismatch endonuclease (patch repair protein)